MWRRSKHDELRRPIFYFSAKIRTMSKNFVQKMQQLATQLADITQELLQVTPKDRQRYGSLSQKHAELSHSLHLLTTYQQVTQALQEAQQLSLVQDIALQTLAKEECVALEQQRDQLSQQIQLALLPQDSHDSSNIFLEIRAGTGGTESALFATELLRMYARYAEQKGWTLEILSESTTSLGGYREVIACLSGYSVYANMKFESGGHRVQRIPQTETQGRIHTSACTVAIMPEVKEIDTVILNPNEVRIDTFRASGAGGQHVNRTDSAVRVTHLPTGIVAECQDGRSQHKNKAQALAVLAARLLDKRRREQDSQQAAQRKSLIGSGDRSERIRTYNFPQGRVTDHRINLTLYKIEEIMDGQLDEIMMALAAQHQINQFEDCDRAPS